MSYSKDMFQRALDKIEELYNTGASVEHIAEELSMDQRIVEGILQQYLHICLE